MKFKVNGTGEYFIQDVLFEIDSPEVVFETPPLESSWDQRPWLYEDAFHDEKHPADHAYNKAEEFFKDFKKAAKKVAKKHGVRFDLNRMWMDSYGYEEKFELLEDDFVPPPPPEPEYVFTESELKELIHKVVPATISAESITNGVINFKIYG